MQAKITRVFSFDASHILTGHRGKCKNLHGHTYTLEVEVVGDFDNTEDSMVLDYGDLKKCVESVLEQYDHAYLFNFSSELGSVERTVAELLISEGLTATAIAGRTTTENIASQLLTTLVSSGLNVSRVRLSETPSTYAEVERCIQ